MSLTKATYSMIDGAPANVRDFGAVGDGVADDTAAIQAAIDTNVKAVVPAGTYKITSALEINANQHLHIATGATLLKNAGTVEPVVRIRGNYAFLTGDGYNSIIQNDDVTGFPSDPSKEGVVNIGGRTLTDSVNINWAKVSNLQIRGNSTRWVDYRDSSGVDTAIDLDVGIKMVNADAFVGGGSDSVYNNTIDNINFIYLGKCLDLEPIVQGNNFHMLYFYRCTLYGIQMKGCNENSLNQTFFHDSKGITFVKLRKGYSPAEVAALGFTDYQVGQTGCNENSFTNLMGEPGPDGPGGRDSRVYDFDDGVRRAYLQGNQNTGHSNIDNSLSDANNFIILDNKSNSGSFTVGSLISNGDVSGTNFSGKTLSLTPDNDTDIVSKDSLQKTYSVRKNLDTGEKIRFYFTGADRRSFGFLLKAKALFGGSNAFSNHGFCVAGVNVLTQSDGTTVNSDVAGMYENNFTAATYVTVTSAGGSFGFYLDVQNPTGDDNVEVSVQLEALDTFNGLNLESVTIV